MSGDFSEPSFSLTQRELTREKERIDKLAYSETTETATREELIQNSKTGGNFMFLPMYRRGLAAILFLGVVAVFSYSMAATKKSAAPAMFAARPKIYARVKTPDDMIGTAYRQHCFKRREKGDNVSIYFDVSGTGATKASPVNITLDLYDLSDPDNVVLMDSISQKLAKDPDTIELKEDSSPPHLGPGPYMTIFSSSTAGAKTALDNTGYYYETWVTKLDECKRYSGN
jgi:hypothetical protein